MPSAAVTELRLVVTVAEYSEAVRFYRDVLGLEELAEYQHGDAKLTLLAAGRATIEIADPEYAEYIDDVEVGRRVAGHIRVAFEVADAAEAAERAHHAGAVVIAQPTLTPWGSLNARLEAPAGLQLTLFTERER